MNVPPPSPSIRVPIPGEVYGVMGEFAGVAELVHAIEGVRAKGYTRIDAYSPFPSHEIIHAMHLPPSRLPWIVLAGGLLGLAGGYFLQIYSAVIDYPTNIGGKPLHSWPFFVPVTFECTILGAALAAVFGMLALNRLPTPYHPVFNHPKFALASRESFFLCVEATDPKFDADEVAELLNSLEARNVAEIDA
jgi:Alternative complex III, ActD subunit